MPHGNFAITMGHCCLGPATIRIAFSGALLAVALSSQCGFDTHLLTRLQIECMALNVLNDFLIQDHSLKALQRALKTLAIV